MQAEFAELCWKNWIFLETISSSTAAQQKLSFFSALTALPLFNYHMWIRKKYRSLFLCRDVFQILKGYGHFTTTADFILVAPQVQVQFLKSVQGLLTQMHKEN